MKFDSKSKADKIRILALAKEQEKPLFSVESKVMLHNLDAEPPRYVIEILALGPKNTMSEKFKPHGVLAELDGFLKG